MGAYILRRLLLVIPTLLGVMIINFTLVQFVPGGPVEQAIARAQGQGDVFGSFAGTQGDAGQLGGDDMRGGAGPGDERYVGARGLPPEFIEQLEREYGFDKPPLQRFLQMLWNYMRFDFGQSYFRSANVTDLILEKMPVSISLGLWSTLIAYLVSIPLGIRKAVKDGSGFDTWTSGAIIVAYAIPAFLFAILNLERAWTTRARRSARQPWVTITRATTATIPSASCSTWASTTSAWTGSHVCCHTVLVSSLSVRRFGCIQVRRVTVRTTSVSAR